eukprot:scaffold7661_cov45-Attheya_sp.AAC.1
MRLWAKSFVHRSSSNKIAVRRGCPPPPKNRESTSRRPKEVSVRPPVHGLVPTNDDKDVPAVDVDGDDASSW